MNVSIDFDRITALMTAAHRDGRSTLFEHEVYELLSLAGAETPPRRILLEKDARHDDATLASIPGDRVVVKVVAPTIVHKNSVGGVRIIENRPERIRAATRRMLQEVPAAYAGWIEREPELAPPPYAALRGAGLVEAIARDLRGVLLCQYMPPDSLGLGSEMIVGVRRTREFGMILTAGLGGTEAELYAARFRKGQAALTASTELTGGDAFFELFTRTISYRKLAGLTRGGRRVVTDAQLLECFASFIALANRYSPLAPDAPFVLEELEVNPFGFTDYLMVPLDGHARFAAPPPAPLARPAAAIDRLLHPRTICIAGVSGSRTNAGRTMLRNILAEGFDPARLTILHPEARDIDSVRCVRSLDELPEKLDLCILAVGAAQVPDLSAEIIRRDAAAAVLLIPAGLGETADSTARAAELRAHITRARERGGGPVFLGGNSLGILSHPGGYDATFIPEAKLPANRGRHARHSAFLSQSGAYMITRMSKLSFMDPASSLFCRTGRAGGNGRSGLD